MMPKNPHPPDSAKASEWNLGHVAAGQNFAEFFNLETDDAWWAGYAATLREHLVAELAPDYRAQFLAGFDLGLEAAQEHCPTPDKRLLEIAADLLAAAGLRWSIEGRSAVDAIEETLVKIPVIKGESPLKDVAREYVQKLLKEKP